MCLKSGHICLPCDNIGSEVIPCAPGIEPLPPWSPLRVYEYALPCLFPAFTLSDLLDMPWSQVSCLLPPLVRAFIFFYGAQIQHSHFSACSSISFIFHQLALYGTLGLSICIVRKRVPCGLEPMTSPPMATRLTIIFGHQRRRPYSLKAYNDI